MLVGEFSPRSVTAAQILLMTRSPGREPHQNHGLKDSDADGGEPGDGGGFGTACQCMTSYSATSCDMGPKAAPSWEFC